VNNRADQVRVEPWAVLAWSLTILAWSAGIPLTILAWLALA
jgi:hypothetical protein